MWRHWSNILVFKRLAWCKWKSLLSYTLQHLFEAEGGSVSLVLHWNPDIPGLLYFHLKHKIKETCLINYVFVVAMPLGYVFVGKPVYFPQHGDTFVRKTHQCRPAEFSLLVPPKKKQWNPLCQRQAAHSDDDSGLEPFVGLDIEKDKVKHACFLHLCVNINAISYFIQTGFSSEGLEKERN